MRKLSLLTILAVAVIATACSGETPPTDGAGPAGSQTPATSRPLEGGGPEPEHQQPFTTTTGQEVQRLFGTLLTAFRRADATMLRSTMPRDLALLCPAESMEPWLLENGPKIQAFELASVFIDAEDPDRGMAQLTLLPERDAAKPLQVESAHWFPIIGVPFPLKREDGHWKVGYPIPHERPACPYQSHRFVPSEPAGEFDYPNIPGLDFNMWHIPFRNSEPNSPGNLGHTNFLRSSDGMYLISSSSLQATDLNAGELMSRYRERLAQASWNIREQGTGADASWFTWTVRDDENRLWYGTLTVSAAGEGWQRVSLFLHLPELR